MPELGFEEQNQRSSVFFVRDTSPDSVIFTVESNFSLFSSASGSVGRCSFTSDVHDHDSLASEVSQHLAGYDPRESSSGPDSDPNKSTVCRNSRLSRKLEKAKGQKEDDYSETEDKSETLDSARDSFTLALKESECRDRRSRSEALMKKPDRRRPASLDLNNHITNATSSSPRLGIMKKSTVLARRTGTCPGTPNYRHATVGIQKGWSSERVPLHTDGNRSNANAALLPFNNGRALPSKWDDAERWILNPVSGTGGARPSVQQLQRRPKSKSGPVGTPGIAKYSYSPAVPMFEGGSVGNLMAGSPFSARVVAADCLSIRSSANRGAGIYPARTEPLMARSVSVHGCSELPSQSSLPAPQGTDEKLDGDKDTATNVTHTASRRDMATQMSPECSPHSSPRRRSSFSPSTPPFLPIVELETVQATELRDVPVDERVIMTRWSKKHKTRFPGRGPTNVDVWKKKAEVAQSCALDIPEAAKSISKLKREEANITAWENLQKAKAEAAMRKLEEDLVIKITDVKHMVQMKLAKMRSSSMDRIINKLRSAHKKAQEMRSSVLTTQPHQVARTPHKAPSFRRTRQISSLSGCFTCHAF